MTIAGHHPIRTSALSAGRPFEPSGSFQGNRTPPSFCPSVQAGERNRFDPCLYSRRLISYSLSCLLLSDVSRLSDLFLVPSAVLNLRHDNLDLKRASFLALSGKVRTTPEVGTAVTLVLIDSDLLLPDAILCKNRAWGGLFPRSL